MYSRKIHFECHGNWRVELTARCQILAEVKIQKVIFQRDTLSLLLFVIAIMPLNYVLKKYTEREENFNFTKSQEKIDHLMYTDDMKVFAKKNEKELETLI